MNRPLNAIGDVSETMIIARRQPELEAQSADKTMRYERRSQQPVQGQRNAFNLQNSVFSQGKYFQAAVGRGYDCIG